MTNNYGDGIAHVNIARKVVDSPDDSLWQRYIQIGSPWLPLQTVLMLPLVSNDSLWRTGAAGSIISMISFVAVAAILYLLARECYGSGLAALLSAGVFVFNPSAIYLQTTPMTEMLFIATLAASVLMLQRWMNVQSRRRLVIAGLVIALATLTRYEAWPVAALAVIVVALCSSGRLGARVFNALLFSTIVACGPLYWLWHNWAIYGNAFEFLTGSSSARGLYLQNRANLGWSQVFVGNGALDLSVMLAAVAVCAGPLLLLLGIVGLCKVASNGWGSVVRRAPLLLLGVPFLFHVFSLYRGEIQIFPLSVFGLLNVRYGLPHLVSLALLVPGAAFFLKKELRVGGVAALALLVALQYWQLGSDGFDQLAVFQEGYRNGVNSRPARDLARFSEFLVANPPSSMILMQCGSLGPAAMKGGLRFSEIIHEGTARWYSLSDGIPLDVNTVIMEDGDWLARRIGQSEKLSRDFNALFVEKYEIGRIKLFERRPAGTLVR